MHTWLDRRLAIFRHEDGRSPHPEHEPESDTHKALKERKARTWQSVGGTVEVEVWRPRAHRCPDVVAAGPVLTVAREVQHSVATRQTIQSRQKALRKSGDRVVWTTDRGAGDITFLHPVPHLSVPALSDHRLYLSETRLVIGAGAITFETQRCGWADLWTGTSRCPVTRRTVPCGRLHQYPTFNPHSCSREKVATTAVYPCGSRLHLDHLLEGILHGSWLPYKTATALRGSRPPHTRTSLPNEAGLWNWRRAASPRAGTGRPNEPASAEPERSSPRLRHLRWRT
ncbi:hypothetical protein [Micromonospora zamorensis]|uniref:competence protein CoiA family protein n=1 Tax=Micromonospora zamorensis TaxID=709883 RepID=UPI002E1996D3